jgi:hydrogenase nickel incorporation protein HypA/HybF
MNAMGLMRHAVHLALEEADRLGAQGIRRVKLRLGGLAGLTAESLAAAFAAVSQGTRAANATVEIDLVLPTGFCSACAAEVELILETLRCSRCGNETSDIRHGRELELHELEVL